MNLCTSCGEDFGSVAAFDTHRVGKFPQTGPSEYNGDIEDWTPEQGRRCLTADEMIEKGFVRNERGSWSLERSLLAARNLRVSKVAA